MDGKSESGADIVFNENTRLYFVSLSTLFATSTVFF